MNKGVGVMRDKKLKLVTTGFDEDVFCLLTDKVTVRVKGNI
jgi:hypothetical protein